MLTMKRRQRAGRELNLPDHSGDNSYGCPNLSSSPRNVLMETSDTPALQIYSTLNSVFEVLLPIEPKHLDREINQDICNGDMSHSDNDSDIDKKYPQNHLYICKSCGFKVDHCGCSGSGDFEDAGVYTSNEDIRQFGAGENIKNNCMQIEDVIDSEMQTEYEYMKGDFGDLNSDNNNSIVNAIKGYSNELESVINVESTKEGNTVVSMIESTAFETSREQDFFSANTEDFLLEVDTMYDGFQENPVQDSSTASASGDGSTQGVNAMDHAAMGDQLGSEFDMEEQSYRPDQHLENTVKSLQNSAELYSVIGDVTSSHAKRTKLDVTASLSEQHYRQSSNSILPVTDSAVLAELLEADEQALRTAALINQMKDAMKKYQEKDQLSEEDTLVLKLKQADLMKKLAEFEKMTERVQHLVGLADESTEQVETRPELVEEELENNLLQDQHAEESALLPLDSIPELDECRCKDEDMAKFLTLKETIPKVIVCGAENLAPRIIVCEPTKKIPPEPACKIPPEKDAPDLMLSLTGRLSESYLMQEKLATENAELEGGRYHLQEELLQKDNTVDALQRKVGSLQTEMRIISKENSLLTAKLAQVNDMERPASCPKRSQKTSKPACVCADKQLQQYNHTTSQLERQLNQIEGEVRCMQSELVQVQRERKQLEQQRKLMKPATSPCPPPPCPPCCPRNQSSGREPTTEHALRELKEQYARLQEDFKTKMSEVSTLRRENEKAKEESAKYRDERDMADAQWRSMQAQLRSTEIEAKKMLGSKEQLMEQEHQLNVAKQRFREAQDELDELRGLIQDQTSQLEDYRNKYLQAQQQVEEQRRQIDVMEMDNSRISEQVNLEIQRVKNQFQEKLQELTPLPDILKATQLKLQEAQQMRSCAERNCEEMARELQDAQDRAMQAVKELEEYRSGQQLGTDERETIQSKLDGWEKKCNELKEENAQFRTELARMEEMAAQTERRLEEKLHEVAQLSSQLETVREESARQVARTKDRSETVRRSLQSQISDLERQLAQSRAAARSAQKDRDEIRQRMQCQINNLNENFDQAQMRIRSLQSHVNFLKTSYTNIFENNSPSVADTGTPSNYGLNTCDCNF